MSSVLADSLAAPPPVYVLVGSESLLVREAEDLVRKALASGPAAAFNHASFSAADDVANAFVQAAGQLPMMATRRLVELRQVQDANVAVLEALLAYVQAPNPTTVVVVSGEKFPGAVGGVDRGIRIVNAVKKIGLVLKLDGEGTDPVTFATTRAKDLGVTLDRDAAGLLAELVGNDLTLLATDVEKCASFVGPGGRIDRAAAAEVCASVAEADVWALTDGLVTRDRDLALATLHRLLEDGEPSHKLLGSVMWQLRQVLLLQDAARRGLSEREAGVRMPPQKARAVRELVSRRPIKPSVLLEELAAVNRAMNSSRAGERRVFEALVLRLTEL